MASSSVQSHFVLNDGTKIPSVGMGCWMGEPGGGERAYKMCLNAIKHGYRHFDTAHGYGNEELVGKAIRDSGVPRREIYLTTKLPNHYHDRVQEALEISLKKLDCEYIDLYLIHWPQAVTDSHPDASNTSRVLQPEEHPTIVDTWKDMEKLLSTGKVKSIGVSNFSIKTLEQILPHCTVVPATNQVELHPCLPQSDLKEYCESKGILLTAYSPLGRSSALFEDKTIVELAAKNNVTPAQIVLSWGVQRGTIVVPKSENEKRMADNITLSNLSKEDLAVLDSIHLRPGMHKSLLTYHKEDCKVFGWTYDQLGWNMSKGGVVESS